MAWVLSPTSNNPQKGQYCTTGCMWLEYFYNLPVAGWGRYPKHGGQEIFDVL